MISTGLYKCFHHEQNNSNMANGVGGGAVAKILMLSFFIREETLHHANKKLAKKTGKD